LEDRKKIKTTLSAHRLGKQGEEIAQKYLRRKEYKIITKGFRWHRGEIDVIASKKETLVFVEVKARGPGSLGLPEESVNPKKQKQIRKIAEAYLALNKLEDVACRFDVISLVFDETGSYSISHIKDAF
jgi:putative endonuclease